ncbi:MAG: hypothetical protein ACLP1Q_14655 [Solirubrobacteraceae bacterium]
MSEKELQRQRRVLSQMLTAQTTLSQRLRRRQQALTITILTLSVIAGSLAFADDSHHIDLGFAKATLPIWAGVLSSIVFALALVDLVVSWREDAAAHKEAARRLALLQARFAVASADDGEGQGPSADLDTEYWKVMTSIVLIPNRQFLALKAEHIRRIEQARLLDRAPGAFVWAIRARLRYTHTIRVLRGRHGLPEQEPPFLAPECIRPDGSTAPEDQTPNEGAASAD